MRALALTAALVAPVSVADPTVPAMPTADPSLSAMPLVDAADSMLSTWDFEPGVRLDLFYEDNVRLSTVDQQSSFGGFAEVYGVAARRTEVSELTFRGVLTSTYYGSITELNSTDGAIEADFAYRMPRTTFGLESSFVYDSTLTSEEETTGIVQVNKRRSLFQIAPAIQYATTERSRIGAGIDFQDVSYEDVDEILLSNYRFGRANINAEYDLTERAVLVGRVFYERYDSDDESNSSTAWGGDAGVRYELSDRTRLAGFAGARSVDADDAPGFETDDGGGTGPIFSFLAERDYGPGLARITLDRSLVPSGRGTLLDTTRAALSLSVPVTERATARLDAIGVRNRNPGGETNFNDRDYFSIQPGLRWQLGEATWLDLSYRYRWQDREIQDSDAQSNAVFFGFGHDWLSR
jgi:hypothetical protein